MTMTIYQEYYQSLEKPLEFTVFKENESHRSCKHAFATAKGEMFNYNDKNQFVQVMNNWTFEVIDECNRQFSKGSCFSCIKCGMPEKLTEIE